uniref:H(+)-transporting two-sector ATPase n=1 Tax=Tetraselmis chuii TaxID=63592 RepID=A0A7S1X862_9CHLO
MGVSLQFVYGRGSAVSASAPPRPQFPTRATAPVELSKTSISRSSCRGLRRYVNPPGWASRRNASVRVGGVGADEGEEAGAPDWDAEMSIFKKRTLKPSQLATLRQIEGEASIGKVLHSNSDLVIVEGLNNDAEPGTVVSFASGARGVLLWRRNDNICFILAFGGTSTITEGTPVQCSIQGILQVIDDEEGVVTKRKFETAQIPVDDVAGQIVNFIGRVKGSSGGQEDKGQKIPLLHKSPNMEDRGQINESLFTGVAAVDTLAPLGRGQSMLLTGLAGSGKRDLMLEAILGQRKSDVHCVLALIGEEEGVAEKLRALLEDKGAMARTTIVEAPKGSSFGQSYLAICTATSIAEKYRDNGGHSLVLLGDLAPMVQLWELFTAALVKMGPQALALESGDEEKLEKALEEEELVQYEGMLVSASAAQRRQFFAALIQRASKMHKRLGGGSLTMVGALAGEPATGISKRRQAVIEQHKTLSAEMKAKLLAALAAKEKLAGLDPDADRRRIRTEVVEEFMSLTDGQIVLEGSRDTDSGCMVVNSAASVSRIGNRAYDDVLAPVATPIRTALAQADDAQRASIDDNGDDINRALRARALLLQDLQQPVLLEDLVVKLYALEAGCLDDIEPRRVRSAAGMIVQEFRLKHPEILNEIRTTRNLSKDAVVVLKDWMKAHESML